MKAIHAAIAATLLATTGLAAAPTAAAQDMPIADIAPGHTLLTVSGEGSVNAAPDIAIFSAGVTTQASTAGAALSENSRKMANVVAALKKAGIAERDIQTSNLSVNPVYSEPQANRSMPVPDDQQMRRIVGYEASNTVMVRQRKLDEFGKVIDTLVANGANRVNGPNFSLEQQDEALDKARMEAVKAAKRKAALYASAAGLKVVRVLSINETGGYARPQQDFRVMNVSAPAAPPPPVQAGELEMQASVQMLYELAP